MSHNDDEELKRKIKEELAREPRPNPQLAGGPKSTPAKSQAEKDAEMKAAIKQQLAGGPKPAPAKSQAEKDAEMKASIKQQLAGGPKPAPAKSQAEKDAEMKASIKQQLAGGPKPTSAKSQAEKDAEMKASIKQQLAGGSKPAPAKSQAEKDAEMKASIKQQLAGGSKPTPAKSQAEKDAEMKASIKQQLAGGPKPTPTKSQAEKDAEMKASIKQQLAGGPKPTPAKSQAEKDAEMKASIKQQLVGGPKPTPTKSQAEKDAEMKASIKQQLAGGPKSPPPKSQANKDMEMKTAIKQQLAGDASVASTKTQAEKDADMKAAIKGQLADSHKPASSVSQAEQDNEMKRQIQAQLKKPPPSDGSPTEGESPTVDQDAALKSQIQAELAGGSASPSSDSITGSSARSRVPRRQRSNQSDDTDKSDYVARPGIGQPMHSSAALEPGSEMLSASIGDDVSMRNVTSVATDAASRDFSSRTNSMLSTDSKTRSSMEKTQPASARDEEGERPGAFSVASRAYGGMPAWIRRQAEQNRESLNNTNNSESTLPPEMRGLVEEVDQSHLPPEMRTSVVTPEPISEDIEPEVISADVTPAVVVDNSKGQSNRTIMYVAIFLVVVGAVVGIVIALSGGDDESIADPTDSPTLSPTLLVAPDGCLGYDINVDPEQMNAADFEKYEELLDNIAPQYFPGFVSPATRNDFFSPEHLGISWLAQNSMVELEDESLENQLLLSNLYFATNGYAWKGGLWLESADECTWEGVVCENRTIVELNLANRFTRVPSESYLVDPVVIPVSIPFLTSLRILDLAENLVRGGIPSEISKLTDLASDEEYLDLSFNDFSEEFPFSDLATLSKLRVLDLNGNDALIVRLPKEIGSFQSLEILDAGGINSAGESVEFPTEIGMLSNIVKIVFPEISGAIPTEIGNLQQLEFLEFPLSPITGSLPSEIGKMTSLRLIQLSETGLTGTIPTEIGLLKNLVTLNLSKTNVRALPTELGALTMLEFIDLGETGINGTLPESWASSESIRKLSVDSTFIEGEIQLDANTLECLDTRNTFLSGWLNFTNCAYAFDDGESLGRCENVRKTDCVCCSDWTSLAVAACVPRNDDLLKTGNCTF